VSSYVPRFGVKSDGAKVDIVEKVMVDLSKRFEGRPGGYTRIIKIGNRRGDNAPMSIIEFIDAAPIEDTAAPESPAQTIMAEPASTASAATTETAETKTETAATE
jgi:large subunit ribosomal protein L17